LGLVEESWLRRLEVVIRQEEVRERLLWALDVVERRKEEMDSELGFDDLNSLSSLAFSFLPFSQRPANRACSPTLENPPPKKKKRTLSLLLP